MIPVAPTEFAPLEFDISSEESVKTMQAPSNKIGWLQTLSDQPGAKFDITIKDALGRVKFRMPGMGTETDRAGALINLETHLGEQLQVEISNVKNAKNLKVYLS